MACDREKTTERMMQTVHEVSNEDLSAIVVKVARERDTAAFEILFRHYAPRVRAYMARLTRDRQASEELMQETLITVWNKAAQFDPARGNVSTWIFTIARNLRTDAYRRERRPAFDPNDPAFVPDDVAPADGMLEEQQDAERLHRAMGDLPAEQVALLRLSFFDEASHAAIANTLDIPLGTVKSRIRLAFAKLRAALEDRS